jgi:hypothetical protein
VSDQGLRDFEADRLIRCERRGRDPRSQSSSVALVDWG